MAGVDLARDESYQKHKVTDKITANEQITNAEAKLAKLEPMIAKLMLF